MSHGRKIALAVCEALKINPDGVTAIEMRFAADGEATLRIIRRVRGADGQQIADALTQFTLERYTVVGGKDEPSTC